MSGIGKFQGKSWFIQFIMPLFKYENNLDLLLGAFIRKFGLNSWPVSIEFIDQMAHLWRSVETPVPDQLPYNLK
jgi:hypothetical protein